MKTFSELTLTDFLTISDTDLTDAIRKQAIVNGLNIPISMPEALTKSTYAGYTPKTDTFTVWQIATKQGYGGLTTGDTAYLTRQAAEFAMQGMILIKPITDKKYNTIGYELTDDNLEFRIIEKSLGITECGKKLAHYSDLIKEVDPKPFMDFVDECITIVSETINEHRQKELNKVRMAEYLRLAGNDEVVAKSFWAKNYPNVAWTSV